MDDQALMELHDVIVARRPKGVRGMSADDRREYNRIAKAKSRAADRVTGLAVVTDSLMRDALADAAQAILATGADGSETIKRLLHKIFAEKPAVVDRIVAGSRSGKLKPKLLKS